jgi:DNA-binding response OmpR family regulator
MGTRILIVEDEEKLAQFVQLELSYEGYEVSVAHDGLSGLMVARDQSPDLIILDWMMPGLSGVELCRRLRQTGSTTPVILLTAKDEISDRVLGLDSGANDYVVKPFSIEELMARVRVQLRHLHPQEVDQLVYADLVLDRKSHQVSRNHRAIELTATEFDLLDYLMTNARQVLSRDRILETVWGYDFMGDSNIIEVYVRYLRLKLEAEGEPRLIQTVRGVGYVLRE